MPSSVLIYGLLGLIPFLAPPLAAMLMPAAAPIAGLILAVYGALILSFLGGARWGLAIAMPDPSAGIISLAMLPSILGLGLLLVPDRKIQLVGLAVALALHWLWDARATAVPSWYARLRTPLTAGALIGLLTGSFVAA